MWARSMAAADVIASVGVQLVESRAPAPACRPSNKSARARRRSRAAGCCPAMVALQRVHHGLRHARDRPMHRPLAPDHRPHQCRDVFAPLAQRRQPDWKDVQAVVQVFAEISVQDRPADRGASRPRSARRPCASSTCGSWPRRTAISGARSPTESSARTCTTAERLSNQASAAPRAARRTVRRGRREPTAVSARCIDRSRAFRTT